MRAQSIDSDLSRVRQILVFERFLERAFRALGHDAVLKGGVALELRIQRSRTTRDVDLRASSDPVWVLERLRDAAREDLGDWLSFEVAPDSTHPEIDADGLIYGGRRYRAVASMAGKPYGLPFGVDIAFAEPFHGTPDAIEGSELLGFVGIPRPRFRIYPIEAHLAEKLHAYTLPRRRPNSRVKDLPDLALLATTRDIDARELREACFGVFDRRATHPLPPVLPPPPDQWVPVYERMAKIDRLPWRTLAEVYGVAASFLNPVLRGSNGTWNPQELVWS